MSCNCTGSDPLIAILLAEVAALTERAERAEGKVDAHEAWLRQDSQHAENQRLMAENARLSERVRDLAQQLEFVALEPVRAALAAKAKEQPVVLVCRTGMQSADAAKKLVKAGFAKVYWLDGGVAAWQQADLPLVKGKN